MVKKIEIENFRGISNKRSISFVANGKRRKDQYGVVIRNKKQLLLTNALLGKNATGKTSFIEGIEFMYKMCLGNVYENVIAHLQWLENKKKDDGNIVKFDLNNVMGEILKKEFNDTEKSLKFSITFIDNNQEIKLNLILNSKGQVAETIWSNGKIYKKHTQSLKDFHSKIFSTDLKFKRVAFYFIRAGLVDYIPIYEIFHMKNKKWWNEDILLSWIKIADSSITKIKISTKNLINHIERTNSYGKTKKIFDYQLSIGTLKWLNLAFYILPALFKKQSFVFIDEIERSFHPALVKFLIRVFNDINLNKFKSQLFFTTHSPDIVDIPFRKDAINFISKDDKFKGIFNAGNDLKLREDLSITKNYHSEKIASHPDKIQILEFLDKVI